MPPWPRALPEQVLDHIPPLISAEDLGLAGPLAARQAGDVVDRAIRLFKFLQELSDLRQEPVRDFKSHPWTLPLADLPEHPSVRCGLDAVAHQEGIVVEVRCPPAIPRPEPVQHLRAWLVGSLDDPAQPPTCREALPIDGRSLGRNETDAERAWQDYRKAWEAWAARERVDAPVRRAYSLLARLRQKLEGQGDAYQLVVTNGLITWASPVGQVCHPLMARRADIAFDNAQQTIRVLDTSQPTLPMFECLGRQQVIPGSALAASYAEVRANNPHPLEDAAINQLIAIRNRWISGREFAAEPRITLSPALLLVAAADKSRPLLQAIVDDLSRDTEAARDALPPALRCVVGDTEAAATIVEDVGLSEIDPDGPGQQILFTKPANVEQARIVAHLRRQPSVVILGPPGTGKTHTIANLIGHYLAEGMSILVTSETAKALGEVRNKVTEDLQPLCVPILSSDQEGRNALSQCVNGITDRLQAHTEEELTLAAARLQEDREARAAELYELRQRLLRAGDSERAAIVFGGQASTPIEAARWLARPESRQHAWIPPGLTPGAAMPLSDQETVELYATNVALNRDDDAELGGGLPVAEDVPTTAHLTHLIRQKETLSPEASVRDGWLRPIAPDDAAILEQAIRLSEAALLRQVTGWMLGAMSDGEPGNARRGLWEKLITAHQAAATAAVRADQALAGHKIQGPEATEEDLEVVAELRAHLRGGGNLGVFTRATRTRWRSFLARWSVNGAKPKRAADVEAVEACIRYQLASKGFLGLWRQVISAEGGPDPKALGKAPERAAAQSIDRARDLLRWRATEWAEITKALHALGLDWVGIRTSAPVDLARHSATSDLQLLQGEILPRLRARNALRKMGQIEMEQFLGCQQLREAVERYPHSAVLKALLSAWEASDLPAFAAARSRVEDLWHRRPVFQRRRELLARLRAVAPDWAAAVSRRRSPHDGSTPPGDTRLAWQWRQFTEELDRRASEDIAVLSRRIQDKSRALQEKTKGLVECKAWLHQLQRYRGHPREALRSWLQTMTAMRAGHVQRMPELLRHAGELMEKARDSLPVWIMPLDRVYQVIQPRTRPRFDIVIVDEASQVGPEGLGLFYLGKRVIVVGDDQQVTPSAIGQATAQVDVLRDQYLSGVPAAHLYDGKRSLYDIAVHSFGSQISLKEHFRSVPEIIAFSNHLCYVPRGQGVVPLRESASASVRPALVAHCVPMGQRREGTSVNKQEARRVAALLTAMVEHPSYARATFGVISMLGQEQSLEVEECVRRYSGFNEDRIERLKGGGGLTRRLCGEPPNFQGDERTVILLSLVDSSALDGPLRLISANDDRWRSRFNVAVSRAQDQLWVVHSLDPVADLQVADLRRRLLEHVADPGRLDQAALAAQAAADSPFEQEVIAALVSRGFRVQPQYPVGAYRIDIVVHDGDKRIAIECDGERYHPPESLVADQRRQTTLERRGWRFIRIRGSAFYRNKTATIEGLVGELEARQIRPSLSGEVRVEPPPRPGLVEDVVRRAEALEREWAQRKTSPVPVQ